MEASRAINVLAIEVGARVPMALLALQGPRSKGRLGYSSLPY